ncbi:hypothetical protein NY551_00455 [Curtobacterium flaccumfaciens pv. oortii]|uniref:hypothetical protein n=1 Tax=Curtobacterium flaccumfaciens TaxID=2035 RepID=UPI0026591994|nr:hypothetical protein [Curtobacterium flaccumfaciens]MCS5521202.1 hypothetical protein [Curtobacterium flaccumfaciens pv. oortii]
MTAPSSDLVTIACDESASAGENLIDSPFPVFVHASTDLPLAEAEAFMTELRVGLGSRATELKSTAVLAPKHRDTLLRMLASVPDRGNIHLVDKSFYVSAKLIDLLLAAHADVSGDDIRFTGEARYLTTVLADHAPADVGPTFWNMLLRKYNAFIRVYARADQTPPTEQPFFRALDTARHRSTDQRVRGILDQLWAARHFAIEYAGARKGEFREMDPMFSTLTAVARTWQVRLGTRPLEFLIDSYALLAEGGAADILAAVQDELHIGNRVLPAADLRAIRQTPSHLDARVQVADILAAVGREASRLAFEGIYDDDLQRMISEMLDLQGMWSDGSPLDVLFERRRPQYARAALDAP